MSRDLLRILAFAIVMAQSMTCARAQVLDLIGTWQQIGSNSGKCPTCQITIGPAASSFKVTANNGWAATIEIREDGDVIRATGSGQWILREPQPFARRPFDAGFVLRDSRLYLTMVIGSGSSARQIVKAVYERAWLGS